MQPSDPGQNHHSAVSSVVKGSCSPLTAKCSPQISNPTLEPQPRHWQLNLLRELCGFSLRPLRLRAFCAFSPRPLRFKILLSWRAFPLHRKIGRGRCGLLRDASAPSVVNGSCLRFPLAAHCVLLATRYSQLGCLLELCGFSLLPLRLRDFSSRESSLAHPKPEPRNRETSKRPCDTQTFA
jgi:hypothetical protein